MRWFSRGTIKQCLRDRLPIPRPGAGLRARGGAAKNALFALSAASFSLTVLPRWVTRWIGVGGGGGRAPPRAATGWRRRSPRRFGSPLAAEAARPPRGPPSPPIVGGERWRRWGDTPQTPRQGAARNTASATPPALPDTAPPAPQ